MFWMGSAPADFTTAGVGAVYDVKKHITLNRVSSDVGGYDQGRCNPTTIQITPGAV
jgi:hypothetical protein